MSVPYQNPISSIQVGGPQSIVRTSVFGTNFSVNSIGGYMEVYNLSDLTLTLTSSTYSNLIQLSANTIPIRYTKGDGTSFSPDYITLNSDNISSGRRRLGMLVYVHETDTVYQYVIPNYDTLWNNLTGLTGFSSVTYSDYTTVVNNRSSAGQSFISGWTSSNIEGVSGYTSTNSNWRVYLPGGSTSGLYLPLSGGTVTGPTIFTGGLSASTISATTYYNLPLPVITGTTNYIPKFTSGTTLTNSLIYDSFSGTGINTSTPIAMLDIKLSATTDYILNLKDTNNDEFFRINKAGGIFINTGATAYGVFSPTQEGIYINGDGSTSYGTFSNNRNIITFMQPFTSGSISGIQAATLNYGNVRCGLYFQNNANPRPELFGTTVVGGVSVETFRVTEGGSFNIGNLNTDNSRFTIRNSRLNLGSKAFSILNSASTENVFINDDGSAKFNGNLTATTISATTYYNLPDNVTGLYLPLSGGTVYGPTIFTSGVTANTLNVLGLTQTSGITSTGGITFKQVTINSSYTATTSDYMIDVTGGTFNVTLPSAVGIQGRLLVVKNNGGGAVTVQPVLGQNIDDKPFVILGETNTIQLASNGSNWIAISYNISTVNSSTGVFEFTGLSIASTTTFNVAPIKGWIVDDTTNPLSPQLYYVFYSGGVHTAIYVNTSTETWVYLTSGGTISQSSIELTEQQRRQNIFLGKLGHANKTNIINAFSQPDFVLSPLAQLRDMFVPINLINGGIYASPNGVNLRFNTSAGYLYGLGINFATSTLNPNSLSVSGTSPCTFQYRTQTGGTSSNTTFIDPTKYDVGGVVTTITGTKATNQRIYLVQNGVFRVQYGQTEYNQLTAAIEGIGTEQFTTFSNFTNNGILIGILSVLSTATDLSDTSKARFFFASKFGETVGSAGGVSTTNLQQAYNNSIQPEIITNTTLGAVTIKNGTGNADNITNLLESQNSSATVTSFIRADGLFSGNSLNLSSSASTINLDNPNRQQIRFFSGGTGAPTYNTYSAGAKIILSDNIDSISSGYAIGVDAGSLWYGADLAGNGHNWYGGTKQLMSLASSSGLELVGLGGPTTVAMTISGTSSLGSKGGVGYMDFLKVVNNFSGATNPNKWFRVNQTGGLEILNSVYTSPILIISDNGIVTITSPASVTSNSATNNALNVGTKGQLFDDGNFHIHSSSGAVWINALDGSAIRLGTQTNTGNSTVIVDTTTVGHSFFTKVQSGFNVAFGTEITMDNLKVRINGTGGSGGLVQAGAVSGSFAAYTTLLGNVAGAAVQGDTNSVGITFTTTYQNISGSQKTLSVGGDTTTLHLIDTTNSRIYRITAIHCQGTTGGYTSIERMS